MIYSRIQYNNAEFGVASGTTDYDVASNNANLFYGASSLTGRGIFYIRIITDQTGTVKFNKTTNDSITLTSSMSPMLLDEVLEVSNVFISNNSGSLANIKVFVTKSVDR